MNERRAEKDLKALSYVYRLDVDEAFRFFIARRFELPPGYNKKHIDVWVEVPEDYPVSPPGVGESHVYVPAGLKYQGRKPKDYHGYTGPSGWAWWCYESVDWEPCNDDLILFFEVIRAHMTNPS